MESELGAPSLWRKNNHKDESNFGAKTQQADEICAFGGIPSLAEENILSI